MTPTPPSFYTRRAASFLIRDDSDGGGAGGTYNWYGWDDVGLTHACDDYAPFAVSLWVEWRRIETSLGVFDWGLQHQSDPTLGKVHYAFERAYANRQFILLRVPAGHWSPDFVIGSTSGLAPSAGLSVNGDGVTPYRMPVIFHPNYRTQLERWSAAIRAFLSTTLPDGSTYADHVIGMPLDAGSDQGSEWPTPVSNKGTNPAAIDAAIDSYGALAKKADNTTLFGAYPRSTSDTRTKWRQDMWSEQWEWQVRRWVTLFPDVPILVAMGQLFSDANATELAWTDKTKKNLAGGANRGHVLPGRTNYRPTGTDNTPSSLQGYGINTLPALSVTDRQSLRNALAAGGATWFQSASTQIWPGPITGAGSTLAWAVDNDLIPNWPDLRIYEAPPVHMQNSVTKAALTRLHAALVSRGMRRHVIQQSDKKIRVAAP